MKRLGRGGTIAAVIAWMLLTSANAMWWLGYGRDVASAILVTLAALIGLGAAYCFGRAVDARRERAGLLWAGRALGLAGAATAVAFPTVLYGEIVMLAQQGKTLTYDIPAAIWHDVWMLPVTVVPALVALRWGRVGGILFLLLALFEFADSLYHFGGVNYFPEARTDLPTLIVTKAPAALTGVLLILGGHGWDAEPSVGLTVAPAAR